SPMASAEPLSAATAWHPALPGARPVVPGARARGDSDVGGSRAAATAGPCARPVNAPRVVGRGWPAAVGASTPRVPSGGARGRRLRAPAAARLRSLPRALLTVPFPLGYPLVLLGTGLYARLGDPGTVRDLLVGSSTDVLNLSQRPLLTL